MRNVRFEINDFQGSRRLTRKYSRLVSFCIEIFYICSGVFSEIRILNDLSWKMREFFIASFINRL